MATIEKRGKSYRFIVSKRYDINSKQLRDRMTWTPDPGMTPKQIEKEAIRQSILFEEQVKHSTTHDGNIRLLEFTDLYMKSYAEKLLKKKTAFNYAQRMNRVNEALGHIKLKDLKPGHIASFYSNLQEDGMRKKEFAMIKIDFEKWLKENNITMVSITDKTGVSAGVLRRLKAKHRITKKCALEIAVGMEIENKDLRKFFDFSQDETPLKAGTIQTFHRVISAILFRAVKWGYISSNPATHLDLPSIAYRRANYLDEPDARRLLELLRTEPIKWRTIITFALLSGLRLGELAGLRWTDVNFDNQTIMVTQTANYLPGEGVYIDTPKSTSSNRPIRLSKLAFFILDEYKLWQDHQQESLGDAWLDQDNRIFTSDEGSPLFPGSINKWFTQFVERTGLPKVTIHSLRHTYASIMIADGIPLVTVSHQLGHAQTSTTANIYAHIIASAEAKAAQTFDKFNDLITTKDEPHKSNPVVKLKKAK